MIGAAVEAVHPGRQELPPAHAYGHNRKSWLLILVVSLAARLRGISAIVTLHAGLLPGYLAGFGKARRAVAGWILRAFVPVVCVNDEIRRAVAHLAGEEVVVISAFLGVVPPTELAPSDRALSRDFHPILIAIVGETMIRSPAPSSQTARRAIPEPWCRPHGPAGWAEDATAHRGTQSCPPRGLPGRGITTAAWRSSARPMSSFAPRLSTGMRSRCGRRWPSGFPSSQATRRRSGPRA